MEPVSAVELTYLVVELSLTAPELSPPAVVPPPPASSEDSEEAGPSEPVVEETSSSVLPARDDGSAPDVREAAVDAAEEEPADPWPDDSDGDDTGPVVDAVGARLPDEVSGRLGCADPVVYTSVEDGNGYCVSTGDDDAVDGLRLGPSAESVRDDSRPSVRIHSHYR